MKPSNSQAFVASNVDPIEVIDLDNISPNTCNIKVKGKVLAREASCSKWQGKEGINANKRNTIEITSSPNASNSKFEKKKHFDRHWQGSWAFKFP